MRNPLFGKIIIVKENIEERNPVLEREGNPNWETLVGKQITNQRNPNWETDYQSTKPWLGNRIPINETLVGKRSTNQRSPDLETEYQ